MTSLLDMNLNIIGNTASIIGLLITLVGFYITISKIRQIHKEYQFKIRGADLLSRLSHFYKEISKCLNNPSLFQKTIDTNIVQCDALLENFENIAPKLITRKITKLRKIIKKYNKTKIPDNIINVRVEISGFIEYLQYYKKD